MTDIVDRLKAYAEINNDLGLYTEANCAYDAIETIQKLRIALHLIGYDYVELSYEKIKWLYIEHIKIAKEAYQKSFPEEKNIQSKPLDDNF